MNRISRGMGRLIILPLVLAALWAAPALAADPGDPDLREERGPFEERNQFPFNLLFLEFPARSGRILPRGTQEWVISQTYCNTFVGSDPFFEDPDPGDDSRQRLTPDLLVQVQAEHPGQSLFFVDSEHGRTELRWRAGLPGNLEAGFELPFLTYRGGAFDGFIEGYHQALNLPNGGRELYVQDLSVMALTLEGTTYFTPGSHDLYQMGDLALFGRLRLTGSDSGDLALSAGVKFPTGDPDTLGGSGHTDYGLEVEGTFRHGRHHLHGGGGWIRTGRWSLFPDFRPADTGSLFVGYEYAGSRLSWIAQTQAQGSIFRGTPGADPDLRQPGTEFLAGVKGSLGNSRWSFEAAFIENLFNQNNGVDIGLRAGVSCRIPPR